MTEAVLLCAGCTLNCDQCAYEESCSRMGTRAVGVACQLVWEPTICIFRNSRPCVSYLVTFRGARKIWTTQVTWAACSLCPVSCFLRVHHCLDWLGTGSWEPESSSLALLGGWDWSWVFVSSPETTRKAAKRWGIHSTALQGKKRTHWRSTSCSGAGTSALLQWGCLHNTYRSKPGERHLRGPEEVLSFQALRSTVLQPSQSKAQETSEAQGSWAMLAGHLSSLGLKALRGRT